MGHAIHRATRAGVTFEVERLERDGDELVVSGHWSGLRGVRFVRPTLVVGDRHVLATLEHKPWVPRADRAWTAAFPWKDGALDASQLALAVAPSVTVPLSSPAEGAEAPLAAEPDDDGEPAPPSPQSAPRAPERRAAAIAPSEHRPSSEPPAEQQAGAPAARGGRRLLEQQLEVVAQERDALRLRLDEALMLLASADAERAKLQASPRRERRVADDGADEPGGEVARARTAAERGRDLALAQLDEAVHDREAAVRTRTRMESALEKAVQARAAAAAEVDRALAERDGASAERDEVRLAYRALRRTLQDGAAIDPAQHPAGEVRDHEPLGERTLAVVRALVVRLRHPLGSTREIDSTVDDWITRALCSVAAASFVLLLVSIIRVLV